MPKNMKSYRLSGQTIYMLDYITSVTGLTETAVIELLISYGHNLIKTEEIWDRNLFTDNQKETLRAYYAEHLLSDLNPKI